MEWSVGEKSAPVVLTMRTLPYFCLSMWQTKPFVFRALSLSMSLYKTNPKQKIAPMETIHARKAKSDSHRVRPSFLVLHLTGNGRPLCESQSLFVRFLFSCLLYYQKRLRRSLLSVYLIAL